ncbi:MAG: undecaprenyl-diphosphate phosphatase [Actinobacteria bacterium]|nr:undecaprenyl-diphosphate phosphatase [Actinomycetota bacterium]
MSLLHVVIYGIVQGLTEFLPVSSTAHLRIVQALMDPHEKEEAFTAFTAVIQLGTTLAVVLYFWRELVHITVAWFRGLFDRTIRGSLEYRMGWYLILATIPVAVIGLVFSHPIETGARNLWVVSIFLIVFAIVLGVAEKVGRQNREEEQLDRVDATAVGLAQALALVPGASRSGVTITAGLFRGLDRPTAARFSFLLSIPAIVLSGLYEARKIGGNGAPGVGLTAVALVFSFVVGLASIAWLMRWISRHSTFVFIGYRIALGALVIVLVATGAVSAR